MAMSTMTMPRMASMAGRREMFGTEDDFLSSLIIFFDRKSFFQLPKPLAKALSQLSNNIWLLQRL